MGGQPLLPLLPGPESCLSPHVLFQQGQQICVHSFLFGFLSFGPHLCHLFLLHLLMRALLLPPSHLLSQHEWLA